MHTLCVYLLRVMADCQWGPDVRGEGAAEEEDGGPEAKQQGGGRGEEGEGGPPAAPHHHVAQEVDHSKQARHAKLRTMPITRWSGRITLQYEIMGFNVREVFRFFI